jgi:hypothetical protein
MFQVMAQVLAAALTAVGFLIVRLLRRDREHEPLTRRRNVVRLHRAMRAARLSAADLRRLERELTK